MGHTLTRNMKHCNKLGMFTSMGAICQIQLNWWVHLILSSCGQGETRTLREVFKTTSEFLARLQSYVVAGPPAENKPL